MDFGPKLSSPSLREKDDTKHQIFVCVNQQTPNDVPQHKS